MSQALKRVRFIHLAICILYWLLWGIGTILVILSIPDWYFTFLLKYFLIVNFLIPIVVPIEPILCIWILIKDGVEGTPAKYTILTAVTIFVNVILWLAHFCVHFQLWMSV